MSCMFNVNNKVETMKWSKKLKHAVNSSFKCQQQNWNSKLEQNVEACYELYAQCPHDSWTRPRSEQKNSALYESFHEINKGNVAPPPHAIELIAVQTKSSNRMNNITTYISPLCKEFPLHQANSTDNCCSRGLCDLAKQKCIAQFSRGDDMGHVPTPIHHPTLTLIEEILIAWVPPLMQFYWLTSGQLGLKGQIVTLSQHHNEFCHVFPWPVANVRMMKLSTAKSVRW